jgi:hypothetical protein
MSEMNEVGTPIAEKINVIYSDGTEEIEGLNTHVREVAHQLQSWVRQTRESGISSMIDRRAWEQSENPYDHMAQAKHILEVNDLVASFLELTEGMTFQGVKWEDSDPDKADIFNQMAAEQDLDSLMRRIWREQYTTSQVVLACWWDQGEFKVRDTTAKGNQRKSVKTVHYPSRITILDNTRIVPVGLLAFGQERLAWRATPEEWEAFQSQQDGDLSDVIMGRFFVAPYVPTPLEREELLSYKIDVERLILLNPDLVSRHTITRSDYERFAPVRLRSIFHFHDLRQQLMEADRVSLIGSANYVLLVKKGDKDQPARQEEINNLKSGFRTISRIPVIFSDHRLSIEIITPKQDFTLAKDKYDIIDSRITQRMLNSISTGGTSRASSAMAETALGKPVARAMEGRRRMIGRYLERELARKVMNHPGNEGIFTTTTAPSLVFTPANISLTDDSSVAQQVLALRTTKDLSRETALEFFGFDQAAEAMRRTNEERKFDDIFQTQIPFSATSPTGGGGSGPDGNGVPGGGDGGGGDNAPVNRGPDGRFGGRPKGGGTPPQNPMKTSVTPSGNTSTKK